jgi:hypothetical protein
LFLFLSFVQFITMPCTVKKLKPAIIVVFVLFIFTVHNNAMHC